MVDEVTHFSAYLDSRINKKKTKVLDMNITTDYQLTLNGFPLEKTDSSVYLGSEVDSKGGCDQDVNRIISKDQAVFS